MSLKKNHSLCEIPVEVKPSLKILPYNFNGCACVGKIFSMGLCSDFKKVKINGNKNTDSDAIPKKKKSFHS